ncbi:helix-turn-helix domain-containing protein [Picrophilus oshimae]|uniref:HTH DNA binding domain n=1 Tax=Picrophilus torridus (strain ATCC 700027 / DSM 9790 / JCM 10055 / NBRC 100828 / KAW 2/3) TaxID=1122961 RepID=A0A8G2FVI8_PICTO|nr:helix-turn-helix domain-containing protein [Picrophilus oshimae]SMD30262.1 HTH DNA binding domain [Picrophilus oshimae DSM 9789]
MNVTYVLSYDKCFTSAIVRMFDVRLRILKKEITEDNHLKEIVEIFSVNPAAIENAIEYLSEYDHIYNLEVISRNDKLALVNIVTDQCPIFNIMKNFGMHGNEYPMMERVDRDGKMFWKIKLDSMHKVNHISEALREKLSIDDISVKIDKGRTIDTRSIYILKEAYELGFFNVPKSIGLNELSEILHIPPTTLNLILRRALKTVLDESLK